MTNEGQEDAAEVRIFPPALPLVTVLVGVGLNYVWPSKLVDLLGTPQRYWVGGLIVAAAFAGMVCAVMIMRRSGQHPNPRKPSVELLEKGPYRFTRNPMYLGLVLMCIGFAILLWNLWILILTPVCAWILHTKVIRPEEEYLERKFGDPYVAYKRRVRRWI